MKKQTAGRDNLGDLAPEFAELNKGGQILLCTDGEGYYQEWGKSAQSLKPGDVVYIASEIKHWHGAKNNSWFTHVAIEIPAEGASNEWLEEVSDKEYNKLK